MRQGNHIGVQWKSATLTGAKSWDEFGWGIAHEIGHNINQNSYAIAEITNNYFAQLLTKDEKRKPVFNYEDVYQKGNFRYRRKGVQRGGTAGSLLAAASGL